MIFKQARLIFFWAYYTSFVAVFTLYVTYLTVIIRTGDEDNELEGVREYIECIYINQGDENCDIQDFIPIVPYWIVILYHIISSNLVIVSFFVFGFRKDIFLFWKEYFIFAWKNKKLPLSFIPSFDPKDSKLSANVETITSDEELNDDNKITKKLQRRIKEL